jgi:hypothetical protein
VLNNSGTVENRSNDNTYAKPRDEKKRLVKRAFEGK